jgi:adenosylcobinamide kinase/adenosylcobinamide-phosphate guanylyltransferase
MNTLILGGVRSGKSRLAETLALASKRRVTYIATASGDDAAMTARIALHRERRPAQWGNVEEKIDLAKAIETNAAADTCLLIDCLSLWMTNLLMTEDDALLSAQTEAFLNSLESTHAEIIMVSSESSMGVIPMGELSRRYCDLIGGLHQRVAVASERVILTVAGLAHTLKGEQL